MLKNQTEFEYRLLGGAVANYTASFSSALMDLDAESMSCSSSSWLLRAILNTADRGMPVDITTIDESRVKAINDGVIPSSCDFAWLVEIAKNGIGSRNADAYAKMLKSNSAIARAIKRLDEVKVAILENEDPVSAMRDARAALDSIDTGTGKRKPKRLDELAEEYLENRVAVYEGRVSDGMRFTVPGMSHAFGPIGHTDFIVIAGRPGSGKTELAVACAMNLAIEGGRAVLYKSLEMEGVEVAERCLLAESGLSVDEMLSGEIFESDRCGLIGEAIKRIKGKPFYIDDSTGCTIDEVCADSRLFCAEHANVGALIVDYVGLMEIGGKFSRHDLAIADITRKLKLLAKELRIPVFGLFQLSRDVEKRSGSKKPVAADLRDSGSIEQDADKIVMVHRECIYDPNTPMQNVAELLNVKRRRGQPTNGYMKFKNGHFVGIPDEEQARWRNTSESPAESTTPRKQKGFTYVGKCDAE